MLRSNRSVINTAVRMMLVEGGCNDIIAEGCKIIREALAAEMDDEELMIPDDSDDIVVDGPDPKEEQGTGNKGEKKEEQGTGNKEGKRRRRKQDAAETDAADSGSLYTSQSRDLAISQSESKSRNLATSQSRDLTLTPEQITTGRAKIMRLIQQRTPPDIPTLVRACIDDGMTASDLAALTGLSYHMIARCKTGAVTSTVADRFQELFAFPRKTAAQSEEA